MSIQQQETSKSVSKSRQQMKDDTTTSINLETQAAGEGPIVMRVRKRDGTLQPVDVNKIVNVALACSTGLKEVDPMRVAAKVISGLYDGTGSTLHPNRGPFDWRRAPVFALGLTPVGPLHR